MIIEKQVRQEHNRINLESSQPNDLGNISWMHSGDKVFLEVTLINMCFNLRHHQFVVQISKTEATKFSAL